MMEGTRLATVDDLSLLEEFVSLAVAEQAENRGGWVWSRRETRNPPFRASLESSFHNPDEELWIGLIDEVPVGYAAAGVTLLRTGELLGVISDIWVQPEAREVGVGEALAESVIAWCTERKCVGIDSMALPGNRATKNFFETFGIKARLLTVHRPLDLD